LIENELTEQYFFVRHRLRRCILKRRSPKWNLPPHRRTWRRTTSSFLRSRGSTFM